VVKLYKINLLWFIKVGGFLVSVHHLGGTGWLTQCQFKVTGWRIMFIWGMLFRCAGNLKSDLSLD